MIHHRRARLVLTLLLLATPAAADLRSPLAPLSDGAAVELPPLDPAVPAPETELGYPLGARFTHWNRIVDYLERLDAASDRVVAWQYGTTYEERPLKLLAISSPENIARLEEVRQRHLRLAEPDRLSENEAERLIADTPVVVWLAYGVHGNESSSAEAAMGAAYVLAAAGGDWPQLLEQAIVLIDPLMNPDGRERYVHFYETRRGREPDPSTLSAEHWEPWPGGRQNHYVIDLNRDWAWATQRETRHRLKAYRQWEPQVFVDLHEMGYESSYFFPPAAEPIHPRIRPETVRWLDVFGRSNAAAFDRQGWLYYVGERFDLFYPGYGDSYPSLRGSVGMTYEMAGHGRAGQSVERFDGTVLTLADRVARHLTTSLATAETGARHRERLLREFWEGRRQAAAAPVRHYLWSSASQEAAAAAELLELHGVRVARSPEPARVRARPLAGGESTTIDLPAGSYRVSTDQPLGGLVRALMEREATMPEAFLAEQRQRLEENRRPQFYDVTAFSLPLAYNLDAWIAESPLPKASQEPSTTAAIRGEGSLGFLVRPQGLAGYRFAGALQRAGIGFRLALGPLRFGELRYPAGTLFVPARSNPPDTGQRIAALAESSGVVVERTASGYSVDGLSLGSDSVVAVRPPRIGLLSGDGVFSTDFGHLWHLLDQIVEADHHRIDSSTLGRIDLSELDVLVMPGGSYRRTLSDAAAETIGEWVESGGLLVACSEAVAWLQDREMTAIRSWKPLEAEEIREAREVPRLGPSDRSLYTPGAALRTRIEASHPLLAGLPGPPAVLYRGSTVLLPTGDPQRDLLLVDPESPVVAGFAWPEAEERLRNALLLTVESRGRGAQVLFAEDPAFRLFWRATAPLFLNAVLYGPSLLESGDLY